MADHIITNPRTLRAMQAQGFIVWPDVRERHWTGATVRSRWVRRGPKLESGDGYHFRYRGQEYRLRYFDGCFYPFVTRAAATFPAGMFV